MKSLSDQQRPKRVCGNGLFKSLWGNLENGLVFVQQDPSVVDQDVEAIDRLTQFGCGRLDAVRITDVDLEKRCVCSKFSCGSLTSLGISRADENARPLFRQFTRH